MGIVEMQVRAHLTARGYARTYQLAERFNISTTAMRTHMRRLEMRGVVERDQRASAPNDICWVLVSPTPPKAP